MIRYVLPGGGYFVSLYSLFYFPSLAPKGSVFTTQVREARSILRRGWKILGYASQMDEEKLSS